MTVRLTDQHRQNILSKADQWSGQLGECEYAGEIVVPEENLEGIAQLVRQNLDGNLHGQVGVCSLVLAVNCMHYDFDEDGFWPHFLHRLCLEDNSTNQNRFGLLIERKLESFGLLHEYREGPWRYVNALKEQCGITHKEIPRYADILLSIRSSYGWDGLRALDLRNFSQFISRYCPSGHLSKFLRSKSGWHFTRSVSRTLLQLESGHLQIEDLSSVRGYHPNFFSELLAHLSIQTLPTETTTATSFLQPRLAFLPDLMQIALIFSRDGVNQRAYTLGDQIITSTPYLLQDVHDFQTTFKGKIKYSQSS